MIAEYILAFVPIFVAVDALGMLPVFTALTEGMDRPAKESLIRQSTLTALVVAILFLWVGKAVFLLLGITMADFLVAGGAILFIISIRDLLSFGGRPSITEGAVGVVPLAVPLIVGPGVMTSSLILLDAYGVGPTVFSLVSNILLCGIVLHFSSRLSGILGEAGSSTISKIANLLLGAIGIMLMRRGILEILAGIKIG